MLERKSATTDGFGVVSCDGAASSAKLSLAELQGDFLDLFEGKDLVKVMSLANIFGYIKYGPKDSYLRDIILEDAANVLEKIKLKKEEKNDS